VFTRSAQPFFQALAPNPLLGVKFASGLTTRSKHWDLRVLKGEPPIGAGQDHPYGYGPDDRWSAIVRTMGHGLGLGRRFRVSAIASALLLALVLSACSTGASVPATPATSGGASAGVLVAKSATVDLGRVPFDLQAEGRFDLVNSGPQPVKLVGAPQVKMLEGC
jgi:hypothetical protein